MCTYDLGMPKVSDEEILIARHTETLRALKRVVACVLGVMLVTPMSVVAATRQLGLADHVLACVVGS